MQRFQTNQLTTLGIIGLLVVFIELTIFNNFGAFLLIIGALLLYYSFSKNKRSYFWIGCTFLGIAILTLMSLRILIVGILLYILYMQYKKEDQIVTLDGAQTLETIKQNKNVLFGATTSPNDYYKWEDVQIQKLIGDIQIDITETILPVGTSVITVRQSIGKVSIVLPYEIPFKLQYSTILGEAKLVGKAPKRLFNEQLAFQDGDYEHGKRKLIIHVATWLGDVEVIRK